MSDKKQAWLGKGSSRGSNTKPMTQEKREKRRRQEYGGKLVKDPETGTIRYEDPPNDWR